MDIFDIISKIQNYTPIAGVLLALGFGVYWKTPSKFIFIYLLSSLILNIAVGQFFIIFVFGKFILSLYQLFEILLWTWMFYDFSKGKRLYLCLGSIGFVVVLVLQVLFEESMVIPTNTFAASTPFIIILCLFYFYQFYRDEIELKSAAALNFLIVAIIFITKSGGFFVGIMIDYITQPGGDNSGYWAIQDALSLFGYISFTFIIWRAYMHEKRQTSLNS